MISTSNIITPLPWSVVPEPSSAEDGRSPRLFGQRKAAEEWRAKNHKDGWHMVLPVVALPTILRGHHAHRTLGDYLPVADMGPTDDFSFESFVDDVFEGAAYEMTCCLWDDWQFEVIEGRVRFRERHQFHVLQYQSIAAAIIGASHDLEAELYALHPALSCECARHFWQSWQVHAHLCRSMYRIVNTGRWGSSLSLRSTAMNELYAAEKVIWSYTQCIATPHAPIKLTTTKALRTADAERLLEADAEVDVPTAALCLGISQGQVRRLAGAGVLTITKDTRPMRLSSRAVRAYRIRHYL